MLTKVSTGPFFLPSMPYQRDQDLPKGVADNLPPGARALWRRVFNAVEKEEYSRCQSAGEDECTSKSEDLARQAAWSSVKRAGYAKGEDGGWQKNERGWRERAKALKERAPVQQEWEEVSDTFHVSAERFKAISLGKVTSAVINTRCQKTGGQRYITVSSGTFPDRMAEIVALHAQQYALTWAQKTGHYGPLRLAHIPHPVEPGASIREQWKALVGDYVLVLDKGLLPMGEMAYQKALSAFRAPSETRVRNLIAMVGKDLAHLVATGKITADVGTCDYQHLQGGTNPAYPGRFLVESGLYDDSALAYKARRYFDANPGEVSIGFLYDRMRLVVGKDGVVYPSYYKRMWRFERSLLPYGAAAFPASYLDGALGLATL